MITASKLAGFACAHAIWCVSQADGLTPFLAFTTGDGQRMMERLAGGDAASAVEHGRRELDADTRGAIDGVLVYDGRIQAADGKLDAVIVEMRCYGFPWAQATIAVPYSPRSSGRFRVHRPKLIEWEECEDFEPEDAFESFFLGVQSHGEGAKVWEAALDESK